MSTVALSLVLVLRIYDAGGLSHPEAIRAERESAHILALAGIALTWIDCHPDRGQEASDERCADSSRLSDVIIRVIADAQRPSAGPLGEAFVDVRAADGSLANIYLGRIRRLAADTAVDPGTLAGRAIAHEVGHLIFGTSSHSPAGLMRARWSPAALRGDTPRAWTFTSREANRLRIRLSERVQAVPDQTAGLAEGYPPVPWPCKKGRGLTCPGGV